MASLAAFCREGDLHSITARGMPLTKTVKSGMEVLVLPLNRHWLVMMKSLFWIFW